MNDDDGKETAMATAPFTFKPTQFDELGNECGSCEGQEVLDADGNCEWCAREIATDPMAVIDARDGTVLAYGLAKNHAEHIKRVRTPGPYTDAGSRHAYRPRIVREADLPRLPCGHADLGRPCSVCAAFADAPNDEDW